MDVEGAEFAAVRGLADRLETLPEPAEVVVEVGPQRAQAPSDVEALFCAFTSAGYTPYAIPNEYEVRDYLGYAPVRSLPRLEPASVNREVNVVFSRAGGDDLAVHAEWRG